MNKTKEILILKSSNSYHVRVNKFAYFFKSKVNKVDFIGWKRESRVEQQDIYTDIKYLMDTSKKGEFNLYKGYFKWILKLFIFLVFKIKRKKEKLYFAVNFESGICIYFLSLFVRIKYIYDIHDEFIYSYNFPKFLKTIISFFERRIRRNSFYTIHVDQNRITPIDIPSKVKVIVNSPIDYYENKFRYVEPKHKFVVSGFLTKERGLDSILSFSKKYPNIDFVFFGNLRYKEIESELKKQKNIKLNGFIPQEKLFKEIEDCCGIFSLYKPNLEINKLAASNKLYDAMMLGKPVITNHEVMNSSFVKQHNIGYVIDFDCNKSWDFLAQTEFLQDSKLVGANGRKVYESEFQFDRIIERELGALFKRD